jgi:hypothetical protein
MSLKQTVRIRILRDLYSGINEFKKGYQPRTNMVKEENGDLLAEVEDYLCQLLNVHGVNDVRQTKIHTAEPSSSEV